MRRSDIGPYRLLPDWILFADISPVALKLWCVLATYANAEDLAWPSLSTLCERLESSKNTVLKARDELIALGCLESEARKKEDGSHASTIYRIRYAQPDTPCSEIEPGVVQKLDKGCSKNDQGGGSNFEHELRTKTNENKGTRERASRFTPPTLEDVKAYAIARDVPVLQAIRFHDRNEAGGWMVGRNKMKDWRAAFRTWESNWREWSNPNQTVVNLPGYGIEEAV